MSVRKKTRKSKAKSKPEAKKKVNSPRQKSSDKGPGRLSRIMGISLTWIVVISAVLVGGWAAFDAMEKKVLETRVKICVTRFDSKMIKVPRWVPSVLSRKVAASSLPGQMGFDDERLCSTVAEMADSNPFIESVQRVTRRRKGCSRVGEVCIEATFRRPYAKVYYGDRHYYVDSKGVRLPAEFVPKYMTSSGKCYIQSDHVPPSEKLLRIHFIVIDGVEVAPPEVMGQDTLHMATDWAAYEDLEDGLKLIELVRDRDYCNQITGVDVRNYKQRISKCEPELRMYAQSGRGRLTEIRFGRFPHSRDWVIPPDRKMRYLDEYVEDNEGTLAGIHSYLDLRYDELHISPN